MFTCTMETKIILDIWRNMPLSLAKNKLETVRNNNIIMIVQT